MCYFSENVFRVNLGHLDLQAREVTRGEMRHISHFQDQKETRASEEILVCQVSQEIKEVSDHLEHLEQRETLVKRGTLVFLVSMDLLEEMVNPVKKESEVRKEKV